MARDVDRKGWTTEMTSPSDFEDEARLNEPRQDATIRATTDSASDPKKSSRLCNDLVPLGAVVVSV
jgi:hypothetical protein